MDLEKEIGTVIRGEKAIDSGFVSALVNATGSHALANLFVGLVKHVVSAAEASGYVPAAQNADELAQAAAAAQAAAEEAAKVAADLAQRAQAAAIAASSKAAGAGAKG